jgi:hypothetical protein
MILIMGCLRLPLIVSKVLTVRFVLTLLCVVAGRAGEVVMRGVDVKWGTEVGSLPHQTAGSAVLLLATPRLL